MLDYNNNDPQLNPLLWKLMWANSCCHNSFKIDIKKWLNLTLWGCAIFFVVYFLILYFNYKEFSFSSLFLNHSVYLLNPNFKYVASFFTNCHSMYVCIFICIHISKCHLLNPYNVACMYVFRAGFLTLDKKLVCLSLERIKSFAPSFCQLPIILCVGLKPLVFYPYVILVVSPFFSSCFDSQFGETLWVYFWCC